MRRPFPILPVSGRVCSWLLVIDVCAKTISVGDGDEETISASGGEMAGGDKIIVDDVDKATVGEGDRATVGDGDKVIVGDGDKVTVGDGDKIAICLTAGEGDRMAFGLKVAVGKTTIVGLIDA